MNKIVLENNVEQIELIKAMASKDPIKAGQAQQAFAASVGPIIQQVINQAPVVSNMFNPLPFPEYGMPSIPLDLFYDIRDTDYVRVWSQSTPGGLPTNEVHGFQELKFTTYDLYSAVAFLKKFAAQGRIDIVARSLNKMAQEFLVKKEFNAATVLLAALAQASTPVNGVAKKHVIRSGTAGTIVLDDFLALFNLSSRILSSFAGGTPTWSADSVTDLAVSPEIVRKLRGFAFQPMNTIGTVTNIPAHDALRQEVYKSAGVPSFYGVNIMQMQELGVGYKYNTLFGALAGSTAFPDATGAGTTAFNPATEQISIAFNANIEGLFRPVATDSDTNSEVVVTPDNSFAERQKKIGFYASVNEGFVCSDARELTGLII